MAVSTELHLSRTLTDVLDDELYHINYSTRTDNVSKLNKDSLSIEDYNTNYLNNYENCINTQNNKTILNIDQNIFSKYADPSLTTTTTTTTNTNSTSGTNVSTIAAPSPSYNNCNFIEPTFNHSDNKQNLTLFNLPNLDTLTAPELTSDKEDNLMITGKRKQKIVKKNLISSHNLDNSITLNENADKERQNQSVRPSNTLNTSANGQEFPIDIKILNEFNTTDYDMNNNNVYSSILNDELNYYDFYYNYNKNNNSNTFNNNKLSNYNLHDNNKNILLNNENTKIYFDNEFSNDDDFDEFDDEDGNEFDIDDYDEHIVDDEDNLEMIKNQNNLNNQIENSTIYVDTKALSLDNNNMNLTNNTSIPTISIANGLNDFNDSSAINTDITSNIDTVNDVDENILPSDSIDDTIEVKLNDDNDHFFDENQLYDSILSDDILNDQFDTFTHKSSNSLVFNKDNAELTRSKSLSLPKRPNIAIDKRKALKNMNHNTSKVNGSAFSMGSHAPFKSLNKSTHSNSKNKNKIQSHNHSHSRSQSYSNISLNTNINKTLSDSLKDDNLNLQININQDIPSSSNIRKNHDTKGHIHNIHNIHIKNNQNTSAQNTNKLTTKLNNITNNTNTDNKKSNSKRQSFTINNATNEIFTCRLVNLITGNPCNSQFSRSYDLTRHQNTIHAKKKTVFRCSECIKILGDEGYSKTFSRLDALTRHIKSKHEELTLEQRQCVTKYAKENIGYVM